MKDTRSNTRFSVNILLFFGLLALICIILIGLWIRFAFQEPRASMDYGILLYVDYSAYGELGKDFTILQDVNVYLDAELTQRLKTDNSEITDRGQRYRAWFSESAVGVHTFYISAPTLKIGDAIVTPTDLPLRAALLRDDSSYDKTDDELELHLVQTPEDHVVPFYLEPLTQSEILVK